MDLNSPAIHVWLPLDEAICKARMTCEQRAKTHWLQRNDRATKPMISQRVSAERCSNWPSRNESCKLRRLCLLSRHIVDLENQAILKRRVERAHPDAGCFWDPIHISGFKSVVNCRADPFFGWKETTKPIAAVPSRASWI